LYIAHSQLIISSRERPGCGREFATLAQLANACHTNRWLLRTWARRRDAESCLGLNWQTSLTRTRARRCDLKSLAIWAHARPFPQSLLQNTVFKPARVFGVYRSNNPIAAQTIKKMPEFPLIFSKISGALLDCQRYTGSGAPTWRPRIRAAQYWSLDGSREHRKTIAFRAQGRSATSRRATPIHPCLLAGAKKIAAHCLMRDMQRQRTPTREVLMPTRSCDLYSAGDCHYGVAFLPGLRSPLQGYAGPRQYGKACRCWLTRSFLRGVRPPQTARGDHCWLAPRVANGVARKGAAHCINSRSRMQEGPSLLCQPRRNPENVFQKQRHPLPLTADRLLKQSCIA
jgi:hypothetical protein